MQIRWKKSKSSIQKRIASCFSQHKAASAIESEIAVAQQRITSVEGVGVRTISLLRVSQCNVFAVDGVALPRIHECLDLVRCQFHRFAHKSFPVDDNHFDMRAIPGSEMHKVTRKLRILARGM